MRKLNNHLQPRNTIYSKCDICRYLVSWSRPCQRTSIPARDRSWAEHWPPLCQYWHYITSPAWPLVIYNIKHYLSNENTVHLLDILLTLISYILIFSQRIHFRTWQRSGGREYRENIELYIGLIALVQCVPSARSTAGDYSGLVPGGRGSPAAGHLH